jgi:hypothetical protein
MAARDTPLQRPPGEIFIVPDEEIVPAVPLHISHQSFDIRGGLLVVPDSHEALLCFSDLGNTQDPLRVSINFFGENIALLCAVSIFPGK